MNKSIFYNNEKKAAALIMALAVAISCTTAAFAAVEPTPDAQEPTTASSAAPSQQDPISPTPSSTPEGQNDPNISENPPQDTEKPTSNSSESVSKLPNSSESKKRPSASTVKPARPSVSVNTDKAEIDQRASQAAEAVSDPNVLSSQTWDELLTSETVSGNTSEDLFNKQSMDKKNGSNSSGFPWLLIVGIALIVAALLGIGYFIYSQFFSEEKLTPGKKSGTGKNSDTQEIQKFTDISSDSSGVPHREDYTPPKQAVYEDMQRKKATKNQRPLPQSVQKPAPNQVPKAPQKHEKHPDKKNSSTARPEVDSMAETKMLPKVKPQAPAQRPSHNEHGQNAAPKQPQNPAKNLSPKAQAQPVEQKKPNNFDWEKFFDESDKK